MTEEAKPGSLRSSSTLPCFRTLAGLNGPSISSVLLLVVCFTDADMDVPGLPFDTVGLNLATGALKVNPAVGEKDGGLAAVALTMGDENVNGTVGGVDATVGSLYVSLTGVPVIVLGAGLDVNVFRGGTGEVKLK